VVTTIKLLFLRVVGTWTTSLKQSLRPVCKVQTVSLQEEGGCVRPEATSSRRVGKYEEDFNISLQRLHDEKLRKLRLDR
jgi:hypothetical protein